MGRCDQRDYARYHEVLNRAVWSPREAARILLMLLLQHLDRGGGPLIFGIDETLEQRRGAKVRARGIYRDAVRSSITVAHDWEGFAGVACDGTAKPAPDACVSTGITAA